MGLEESLDFIMVSPLPAADCRTVSSSREEVEVRQVGLQVPDRFRAACVDLAR